MSVAEYFIWSIVLLGIAIGVGAVIGVTWHYSDSVIRPRRNLRRRDMQLKRRRAAIRRSSGGSKMAA
jgi:hypothetical protein